MDPTDARLAAARRAGMLPALMHIGELVVRGLTPKELRRIRARSTYLDGRGRPQLDVDLFQREEFRLAATTSTGAQLSQQDVRELVLAVPAAAWRHIIAMIDHLSGLESPHTPESGPLADVLQVIRQIWPHRVRLRNSPVGPVGGRHDPCARPSTRPRERRHGARRAAGIRAGQDPGDPDPEGSPPRLRLAPKPGAIYTFGRLSPEARGAEVEP